MMTHANIKKSHPLSELVAFPFKGQNILRDKIFLLILSLTSKKV